MSLSTNIVRRKATYYVRLRVPTDLLEAGHAAEKWQSLRTTDVREARRLGAQLIAATHKEWSDMRRLRASARAPLKSWDNDEHVKPLIAAYTEQLSDHLDEQAQKLAQPPRLLTLTDTDLRRYAREYYDWEMVRDDDARSRGGNPYPLELPDHSTLLDLNIRETINCLNQGQSFHLVAHYADVICARDGIPKFGKPVWEHEVGEPHPTYRRLGHALLRAHLEALRRQQERQDGRFDGVPSDPLLVRSQTLHATVGLASAAAVVSVRSETLRVRAEQYLTERGNTISAEWVSALRAAVQLFIEFAGESTLASSVTKKLANGWKEALHRYPSRGKIRYPKLDFRAILERNAIDKHPALAARTINKYLTAMSTLYDWIVRHEHDGIERNPFAGLRIDDTRGGSKRDPFSSAQLATLFHSPLFSGCKLDTPEGIALPGSLQARRDWRWWLPLLGLFTGARLGELAQLCVDDIRTRDGLPYISINETGGKKIKTSNAQRNVPIHATLVGLGFIDYVEGAKAAAQTRIFPEIEPDGLGRISSKPSKFFASYFTRIGIKTDSRLTVHSFRHTFIDALREAGFDDRSIAPLIGHGTGGAAVTAGYGIGPSLPLPAGQARINAIKYDLDLTHLAPAKDVRSQSI